MGLDIYLQKDGKDAEQASSMYPNHIFKCGYFRSSYNDSGYNYVVEDAVGETLYSILGVSIDDYKVTPDWAQALVNAENVLEKLQEVAKTGVYRVMDVSINETVKTDREVLADFKKTMSEEHPFSAWSNYKGFVDLEGITIYAVTPGINILGNPCVHLVYKLENLNYYIQATEIVIETIKMVLRSGEHQKYSLLVSG